FLPFFRPFFISCSVSFVLHSFLIFLLSFVSFNSFCRSSQMRISPLLLISLQATRKITVGLAIPCARPAELCRSVRIASSFYHFVFLSPSFRSLSSRCGPTSVLNLCPLSFAFLFVCFISSFLSSFVSLVAFLRSCLRSSVPFVQIF